MTKSVKNKDLYRRCPLKVQTAEHGEDFESLSLLDMYVSAKLG